MAYKFGNWDLIRLQLRHVKDISVQEIHRYVHYATKLRSFRGLFGLNVDIEDLGSFSKLQLTKVKDLIPPAEFKQYCKSYLPPPLFWYKNMGFSQKFIDSKLAEVYIDRFGLRQAEVALAISFF